MKISVWPGIILLIIIPLLFIMADTLDANAADVPHIKADKVKIIHITGFLSRCKYVELTDWCIDIQAIKAQLGIVDGLTLAY